MKFAGLLLAGILMGGTLSILAQDFVAQRLMNPGALAPYGFAGGGGQVEPSAYRHESFTKLGLFTGLSMLGPGEYVSTNASPRLDLRAFGSYLSLNHGFTNSGFDIHLNVGFANAGAFADYYPFRKPFRFSPGYLFYNGNQASAQFNAEPNVQFTINNVNWTSDNADPVVGNGHLTFGGRGFLLTAGYGRYVTHTEKHFSFPFEAGVAFIDTPRVSVVFGGEICASNATNCQPVSTYPGFSSAVAAQLASWNRTAAPYHIYPIIEGGVAYTFRIRQ